MNKKNSYKKVSKLDNRIDNMYNDFFGKCKKSNCCGQKELLEKYNHCFLYDRSIKHSKNYEKTRFKVLIVGIESRGVMQATNNYKKDNLDPGKNGHWIGTVLEIIRATHEYDNTIMDYIEGSYELRNKICEKIDFAFTDFYKCAFSKEGTFHNDTSKQHSILSKNCVNLFEKEIRILKPNLIIIQGINSGDIIKNSKIKEVKSISRSHKDKRIELKMCRVGRRNIKILITPFPMFQRANPKTLAWKNIKYEIYKLIDKAKTII